MTLRIISHSGQKRLFADQVYRILAQNNLLADYDNLKPNDNWQTTVPVQLRDTIFKITKSTITGKSWIEMDENHRSKVAAKKMEAPTYDLSIPSQFFRVFIVKHTS